MTVWDFIEINGGEGQDIDEMRLAMSWKFLKLGNGQWWVGWLVGWLIFSAFENTRIILNVKCNWKKENTRNFP